MVQLDYGQNISFLVIDNRLQMRVDWRWILFHIFWIIYSIVVSYRMVLINRRGCVSSVA
jgi:hypothetical protein